MLTVTRRGRWQDGRKVRLETVEVRCQHAQHRGTVVAHNGGQDLPDEAAEAAGHRLLHRVVGHHGACSACHCADLAPALFCWTAPYVVDVGRHTSRADGRIG